MDSSQKPCRDLRLGDDQYEPTEQCSLVSGIGILGPDHFGNWDKGRDCLFLVGTCRSSGARVTFTAGTSPFVSMRHGNYNICRSHCSIEDRDGPQASG